MIRLLISLFSPSYPATLVYMLQSTEYQVSPYLAWYWRCKDFSKVMYRRRLQKTRAAGLLLAAVSLGMILEILVGLVLLWQGSRDGLPMRTLAGVLAIILSPIIWAHLLVLPLWLGRWLIVRPRQRHQIKASAAIFAKHPGTKIAVAGSYGKTSMKELLKTVLSQGKTVAATPANKNVASSHAIFAQKLTGQEDVLIIEYGEGRPGDVARFAQTTQPNLGVITGLAPAHLDQYPSLQAAGEDIFALADFVGAENAFVNGQSAAARAFIKPGYHVYDDQAVLGWKISAVKIDFSGTKFTMKRAGRTLHLASGLLGQHQVGPLALAVALADKLGLSKSQIETGISQTAPFEHRMQARALHGAWILDDTYNGNIDGLKAGLQLLKDLPGQRKIYVTPGLVDQGEETDNVHRELGQAIAAASPDRLVLMQNSATALIRQGLEAGGYSGELQIEERPLEFYSNLEHFLAKGDVIMLQNDWTDNYN